MGKKIAIKGKESQTGYLDDMQPAQEEAKDSLKCENLFSFLNH